MRSLFWRAVLLATLFAGSGLQAQQQLAGKDFTNRDLRQEDLVGADLSEANLTGANLTECLLQGANLQKAILERATLTGADLTGADLRGVRVSLAGMQGANLSKANLEGVDLQGVSLQNAVLRGANLRGAKGLGDITRADLREADLRGAYLLGVRDYAGNSAQFTGARYDRRTRWPKGFDPVASGAILEEAPAAETPAAPVPEPAVPAVAATEPEPAAPALQIVNPNPDPKAPPVPAIQAAMTTFWGREQVTNTYTWKRIQYGPARKGEFRTDGVPANRETIVYPVLIEADHTVEYNTGETKTEAKAVKAVFFLDEFGDWTWRLK